ncbi:vacuolar protein sorting associated protein 33A [Trichuris trichiura]|uniref:Vacuolar protein sorting associated protein 33A n=1 Tax=Trichuris trichiura TaxID=36087 RepID=A0A077Z5T0_TRITR|nr:vacuolar protein sorting associated protein 33A [Trichuris trichiura]
MPTSQRQDQAYADFNVVKEVSRKLLFSLLDRIVGSKTLIWDADLMQPFDLITGFKDLQDHQVEHMLPLKVGCTVPDPKQTVIILVRPRLCHAAAIASVVKGLAKTRNDLQCYLILVPHVSVLLKHKLKELKVFDQLTSIEQLPVYFFALDKDLISMEIDALPSILVDNDIRTINTVAQALLHLEETFGTIGRVFCKGNIASEVWQSWKKLRDSQKIREMEPLINAVIIVDRVVDLVTPMVTQLSYEGLIDEIYNIKCGCAKFPRANFTGDSASSPPADDYLKLALNSNDILYSELRDLNFSAVGPALSKRIKALSAQLDVRRTFGTSLYCFYYVQQRHNATSIGEYRDFVKRLPSLQAERRSAATHTTIAEMIKEVTISDLFIETLNCEQGDLFTSFLNCIDTNSLSSWILSCIHRNSPIFQVNLHAFRVSLNLRANIVKVLRLMCLQSLVGGGLKRKVFDQYRKELVQQYGYQHLMTLLLLEKAGLLKASGGPDAKAHSRLYSSICRAFMLICEEIDEINPEDISYVYSGFAPLIVRLCEQMSKPGWQNITENLEKIPGAVKIIDKIGEGLPSIGEKVVLVFFVGGVTLAEVSALRFLTSKTDHKFIVATTNVITGSRLLSSFTEFTEAV